MAELKDELKKVLTCMHKDEMVNWVNKHNGAIKGLVQIALGNEQPYGWRASWLLWSCMQKNDPDVREFIPEFIDKIPFRNDNQVREYYKILYLLEIPEEWEGKLFDLSVKTWSKIALKPAVRLNAFKVILKIVEKNSELRDELNFLVEDHYLEDLSPGVKHSINKMIKTLKLTS